MNRKAQIGGRDKQKHTNRGGRTEKHEKGGRTEMHKQENINETHEQNSDLGRIQTV